MEFRLRAVGGRSWPFILGSVPRAKHSDAVAASVGRVLTPSPQPRIRERLTYREDG